MITIANANALHIPLPDQSVQCVVTSPPYWGLRDYGISDQIGLESTPAEYVAVMRECWRVLRDDGTLWLNLGDSYAMSSLRGNSDFSKTTRGAHYTESGILNTSRSIPNGLKPKDLCGIPWRVAFALQDDGWYLRSDIIWHKPNPMPESVTDRPTKAHEYVFLLTKQARYYYDAEAIKEKGSDNSHYSLGVNPGNKSDGNGFTTNGKGKTTLGGWSKDDILNGTRNRRSVWTITTSPYSGAHFATFPPALIEPMILAGTSARGECPQCGKAWVRVVERTKPIDVGRSADAKRFNNNDRNDNGRRLGQQYQDQLSSTTLGWRPSCSCPPHDPIPQTVLDPFAGSGTTGQVAVKHGRRAVLLDLNTKYIDLQFERTNGVQVTMQL